MASTFIRLPPLVHEAAGVLSYNDRTGIVSAQAGDYLALEVAYDPTVSEMVAVNVQDAIDELDERFDSGNFSTNPTSVRNDNYEYLQNNLLTTDANFQTIFEDLITDNGIYLYELKIVGFGAPDFASFKRDFSVVKDASTFDVLGIQSPYTEKSNTNWAINISKTSTSLLLQVKGDGSPVTWVTTIVKTMFKL